jgi:hypothetical protein
MSSFIRWCGPRIDTIIIRGNFGDIGAVFMGFEKIRRCVLGLYWLQKPINIMWPDLQSGD